MAGGTTDAKQGLGYDLIVNGRSLALDLLARIIDPSDLENEQDFIPTTHSKTVGNKSEQPDELGNPLTRAMSVFYNAGNTDLLDFLKAASRSDLRSLIDVHPIHPGQGNHPAFIRACGFVTMGTISQPLDGEQEATLNVKYNEADDVVEQQDVAAPVTGDIVETAVELSSANISAGTVVATLAAPLYASGASFFLLYLVSGTGDTDNASVELVGIADGRYEVRATGAIGIGALDFLVGVLDYPTRDAIGDTPITADTQANATNAITLTIVA